MKTFYTLILSSFLFITSCSNNKKDYNLLLDANDVLFEAIDNFQKLVDIRYLMITSKFFVNPEKFNYVLEDSEMIEYASIFINDKIDSLKNEINNQLNENKFTISSKLGNEEKKIIDNLNNWVNQYNDLVIEVLSNPEYYYEGNPDLSKVNKIDETWYKSIKEDMSIANVIFMLSKLQLKLKNLEYKTLDFLISNIESLENHCLVFQAFTNAPKNYVKKGEEFTADISLRIIDNLNYYAIYFRDEPPFYDSTIVNGIIEYNFIRDITYDTLTIDKDHIAKYSIKRNKPGSYSYGGLINYRSKYGDILLPFEGEYQVYE